MTVILSRPRCVKLWGVCFQYVVQIWPRYNRSAMHWLSLWIPRLIFTGVWLPRSLMPNAMPAKYNSTTLGVWSTNDWKKIRNSSSSSNPRILLHHSIARISPCEPSGCRYNTVQYNTILIKHCYVKHLWGFELFLRWVCCLLCLCVRKVCINNSTVLCD